MTARRVLVVDDSRFVCEAIGLALRKLGLEVRVARDLWDLERDTAEPPDLVLMDVVLQEAFGDEVAGLLRATQRLTCPILLMSSLPDAELAERSADAGLDGFVSKRGGIGPIVARVRELLGGVLTPTVDLAATFAVEAHQRLRQVLHISGTRDYWNAAAVVGEMHALAGDADLVGSPALAAAARECHASVRARQAAGWSPEISSAIDALVRVVGDNASVGHKLLFVDDSNLCNQLLLAPLDRAGHIVVEARTLAEARQKLRTTEYTLVVVRAHDAALPEIRALAPKAKLVVVGGGSERPPDADVMLSEQLAPDDMVHELERLLG
jgi:DNA-binding response OmpR family regulator